MIGPADIEAVRRLFPAWGYWTVVRHLRQRAAILAQQKQWHTRQPQTLAQLVDEALERRRFK